MGDPTRPAAKVHVLVINWNGLEHLQACFDSLVHTEGDGFRFVLLDNGSDDGSQAFVRERYAADPRVTVYELNANFGWSGGNNAGIMRALDEGADYVFLLNNDTRIAPEALQRMLAFAEADPSIGIIAPKMVLYNHPELLNSVGVAVSRIGSAWDRGLGCPDGEPWNLPEDVPAACGGAMFVRAEVFHSAGLLPEEFGIYCDDVDLCLRAWEAGFRVQTSPDAVVYHKFSATMGQGEKLRRKYYLSVRNRLWLLLRNYPLSQLLALSPKLLQAECRTIGRSILDGAFWRIPIFFRAYWAAICYIPRALHSRRGRIRTHPLAFLALMDTKLDFGPAPDLPSK